MDKGDIIRVFLRRMVNHNIWGGKHTEEINLRKSLPKHMRGEKAADDALDELISKSIIFCKMSTGERHLSLNPEKKKEICEILGSA